MTDKNIRIKKWAWLLGVMIVPFLVAATTLPSAIEEDNWGQAGSSQYQADVESDEASSDEAPDVTDLESNEIPEDSPADDEVDDSDVGIIPLSNTPIAVGNWVDLRAAVDETSGTTAATPRTITISNSFTTISGTPFNTDAITIPAGQHIRLVSGGITTNNFNLTQESASRHFILEANSSLTLERVTLTRATVGSPSTTDGGGIQVNGGHLILNNAAIIQNSRAPSGGGVYLSDDSSLTMTGGIIRRNHATSSLEASGGGGVMVNGTNAVFVMRAPQSGEPGYGNPLHELPVLVENRAATSGGGVHVQAGTFDMEVGTIGHEDSSYRNQSFNGGGIYLAGGQLNFRGTEPKNIIGNWAMNDGDLDASGRGGGIHWSGGELNTTANTGEINITDNHARAYGGGIHMSTGALTIDNNWDIARNSSHRGAGISVHNAQLTQVGGEIHHNQATGTGTGPNHRSPALTRGGGVILTGTSIFNMTSGEIHHNDTHGSTEFSASGGNGIHMSGTTIFNMSGDAIIRDNGIGVVEVYQGPGFINHAAGGIFAIENSTFNMSEDSQILNNTSEASGGGFRARGDIDGIGVRVNLSDNALIAGNHVGLQGAGFLAEGNTTVTMSDTAEVSGNTSNRNGGGIELRGISTLTMLDNTLIYDNLARGNFSFHGNGGGARTRDDSVLTLTDNARIAHNRTRVGGGGIAMMDRSRLILSDNSIVEYNEAGALGDVSGEGGGLHVEGGALADSEPRVIISDDARIRYNRSHHGGGILARTSGRISITGGRIYGHTRQAVYDTSILRGGGIRSVGVGIISISGGVIEENRSVEGAGISLSQGTISMRYDALITNNIASGEGGGIFLGTNGDIIMNDGNIINNTVTGTDADNGGGGIYINSDAARFVMRGGNIGTVEQPNRAHHGGGVRLFRGRFDFEGGNIVGNIATQDGGGIHQDLGRTDFLNGSVKNITDNSATNGNGGGINLTGGETLTALNAGEVNITRNTAYNYGGGISLVGGSVVISIREGWLIAENEATNGSGGGVALYGGGTGNRHLFMSGGRIENNHAGQNGGGVYVNNATNNATFNFDAGIIGHENPAYGNTAENGGGVQITAGRLNLSGLNAKSIIGNTATTGNGGGINWISGILNTSGGSVTIADNMAEVNGGGINWTSGDATFSPGIAVENNTAINGNGGGINWITGDATFTSGANVENNTAANGNGGGIHILDGHITLTNAQVRNNEAGDYGGGIWVSALPARLTASGGSFTDNHAGEDGGGIWTGTHDYMAELPITTPPSYGNLSIAEDVAFADNSAGNGSFPPPANWDITDIRGDGVSPSTAAHQAHQLNNYDVNFQRDLTVFEFIKVEDDEITPLPDAVFSLYQRNAANTGWESVETGVVSADETGLVNFETLLRAGRQYRISETYAPAPFATPTGYWVITVDANGTISLPTLQGEAPNFILRAGDFYLPNHRVMIPITGLSDDTNHYVGLVLGVSLVASLAVYYKIWQKRRQSVH